MPFTMPPISRREFLSRTAMAAGALLGRRAFAAEKARDANRWIFFSDTHVAADPAAIARETNMVDNVRKAADGVLALPYQPAGVFVNGDCAYNTGELGDYRTFTGLMDSIRAAGNTVHITLGNHDHREHIREVVAETRAENAPVPDKHVAIVRGEMVNWFLVDSLEFVNKTPGLLGQKQIAWLEMELDANADKPAIVIGHHTLKLGDGEVKSEMKDSAAFLAALAPRRHVKAYVFGHSHTWAVGQHDSGIHLVNLPPTAYVFNKARPQGWVEAALREDGMTLKLSAFDAAHPEHGQTRDLAWR